MLALEVLTVLALEVSSASWTLHPPRQRAWQNGASEPGRVGQTLMGLGPECQQSPPQPSHQCLQMKKSAMQNDGILPFT